VSEKEDSNKMSEKEDTNKKVPDAQEGFDYSKNVLIDGKK